MGEGVGGLRQAVKAEMQGSQEAWQIDRGHVGKRGRWLYKMTGG